jgi:Holliday junction resolvase
LSSKNYKKGANYEDRFCRNLLKRNLAVVSKRFYASKGITDVYWVNHDGKYMEAQLKYSKNKPYISKAERKRLSKYANKMPFPVFLVMKQARKQEFLERM